MKISLEVTETDAMYLREVLASGKLGDDEFTADTIITDRSFLIGFRGKHYLVKTNDIVKAVLDSV